MRHGSFNPRPVTPGALVADFVADWSEHGRAAIEHVRAWMPHRYLHIAAALAPQAGAFQANALEAMSEEELQKALDAALEDLARSGHPWVRKPADQTEEGGYA